MPKKFIEEIGGNHVRCSKIESVTAEITDGEKDLSFYVGLVSGAILHITTLKKFLHAPKSPEARHYIETEHRQAIAAMGEVGENVTKIGPVYVDVGFIASLGEVYTPEGKASFEVQMDSGQAYTHSVERTDVTLIGHYRNTVMDRMKAHP